MRAHDDGVARRGDTRHSWLISHAAIDLFLSEYSSPMRTGNDAQATAVLVGRIDMQSDRDHFVEDRARRLHVMHGVLE